MATPSPYWERYWEWAEHQRTSEMATPGERNWTAHLVISSEHAGLRPHFKWLEAELYHVLARIDDPRKVIDYLRWLRGASAHWLEVNADVLREK